MKNSLITTFSLALLIVGSFSTTAYGSGYASLDGAAAGGYASMDQRIPAGAAGGAAGYVSLEQRVAAGAGAAAGAAGYRYASF